MQTVSEKSHFVKALIYGPEGCGKTRFTADAPNPWWQDYEDSTETLAHWPEYSHIPVDTPKTMPELLSNAKKAIRDSNVETFVLDTVSMCLEKTLRAHMDEVARGKNGRRARDKYEVHEGDYKYITAMFADLMVTLQDAPINVVMIGHERMVFNEEGTLIKIVPQITPKLQEISRQLFNVVAYMKLKPSTDPGKREREMYVNPTALISAKNRLNIQETTIKNPKWKDIFKP